MDGRIIILFAVVLVLGGLLLFFITLGKGGKKRLDTEKYRVKWLSIEQQLKRDDASSYQLVILNADKLLGEALKERGFSGNTMGERMKTAKDVWSSRDHVWAAHKVRNRIAHESDVKIGYDMTRRALAAFKQALKDVGAI